MFSVAEKMAALEVVKRRLDATGVGDACLELHSNKANKRAVLDELRRTWELGAPRGQDRVNIIAPLEGRVVRSARSFRLARPAHSLPRRMAGVRVLLSGGVDHDPGAIALLSMSMSTDVFAAAVGRGASRRPSITKPIRAGAVLGIIESLTPVIGWMLGILTASFVQQVDHWIAFFHCWRLSAGR